MKKTKVDQAWANRTRVIRTAIRLKHAIEADNEINEVLAEEKAKFEKAVHRGALPAPLDTRTLLG